MENEEVMLWVPEKRYNYLLDVEKMATDIDHLTLDVELTDGGFAYVSIRTRHEAVKFLAERVEKLEDELLEAKRKVKELEIKLENSRPMVKLSDLWKR